MLRAAPSGTARGALRWDFSGNLPASGRSSARGVVQRRYRKGMERKIHLAGCRFHYRSSFTLPLSGFGVERSCLGEVVSLVGDCRPPPPGNPHRPSSSVKMDYRRGGTGGWMDHIMRMGDDFTPRNRSYGGIVLSGAQLTSYSCQFHSILKELNRSQYFKITRSYSSCTGGSLVLEFGHLHYYLCGLNVVEAPSIAITFVLETR
jgi:hypothetical protein